MVVVKEIEVSTFTTPSPKQIEAAFVILKTIKDFQFATVYGLPYTEMAKHLFIAKQEKFEVRFSFDYPANYPTSPSLDLMQILGTFVNSKILKKNSVSNGNYFKVTGKGLEFLSRLEELLKTFASGADTISLLEELHDRERRRIFSIRDRTKTPTEELQRKEVSPLMLNLLKDVRLIYIHDSLKRINRSDLLVPSFEELDEEEVSLASESAIDCLEGKKQQLAIDEQSHEISKKGEIIDFTTKLMFGLEKYHNRGFKAKSGELALLHGPIKYEQKNNAGQIYTVGTLFNRKILVGTDMPLSINVGHHREVFVLALIKKGISEAIAIGVPVRFYDELNFLSDDYCEETLYRILSVIRLHLNFGESNNALKKFYDQMGITRGKNPEEATAEIMFWLRENFSILDKPQIGIDDPYPEFEKTSDGTIPKGHVNNCKEFAALVAILITCLPLFNHAQLFIQFCTVKSGRSHVRMCIKCENGLLLPLDLEYIPVAEVLLTRQLGGKRSE